MKFLQRNWLIKLSSLLLAFSLYVWVQRQEAGARREFMKPVNIPVPAGQELVAPTTPPLVRVIVEGPAGKLEDIREGDLRPIVPMEGYRPGEEKRIQIHLERSGRAADEDIHARVQPTGVTVLTQPRIERKVPVLLDTEAALPEGWAWATQPQPDAEQVTVSGLKPAVERVVRVVATMRALNPQEQVTEWVPLEAVDRSGAEVRDNITLDPKQVRVQARLQRTVWSKPVLVQPVFSVPAGNQLRVTVEPKRVTVYGSARALQDVHFIETPELDIPFGQARFFREVRLDVPAGISRVEPPTVRITIDQVPTR